MNKQTITRQQALELIKQAKEQSHFYSAKYLKANGELREAVAHPNVQKFLKGGVATYNSNPDNVGYYDLNAKGYRCFNINRVLELTVNKQHYIVQE